MKVALCLYGLVGSTAGKSSDKKGGTKEVLNLCYDAFKKMIIDKNDTDVFFHTWDTDVENELVEKYKLQNIKNIIVFTQHPIPVEKGNISKEFESIENAFKRLEMDNFKIICTYPNSDIGGKEIIQILKKWNDTYEFIDLYQSLGRRDFHGLLNLSNTDSERRSCCLGNSSAGIKETPALKVPSIIIGNRQKGRLHSSNVLFVNPDTDEIVNALHSIFKNDSFLENCKNAINPYGEGLMGKASLNIIENLELNSELLKKQFTDL